MSQIKPETDKIRLGISHGDVNGIGYEVILKTLSDNRITDFCTPIVYGSPKIAAYHRKALNISNINFNNIRSAEEARPKRLNIINCIDDNTRVELGKSTEAAGKSAFDALNAAVDDLKNEKIDVLITAPINKQNIQSKNFNFPGHTEFLASKFDVSSEEVMIMINDELRVAVATGHVPLSEVPKMITKELLLKKIRTLNNTMLEDFGIRKPRIAVLGLNPHAGDNGVLGNEELDIIVPVLQQVKEEGIIALGPYSADGLFGSGKHLKFDIILAMYHDQGLAPFKAFAFDNGVNYTAGLPFIRTSPGHGTAYEIAGKNQASENSFRQAMFLACSIFKNRNSYQELISNKLEPSHIEEQEEQMD